jgi:hypothetical protein
MRATAVRLGVASETTINDLLTRLQTAIADRDLSRIGPIYLETIATCPGSNLATQSERRSASGTLPAALLTNDP